MAHVSYCQSYSSIEVERIFDDFEEEVNEFPMTFGNGLWMPVENPVSDKDILEKALRISFCDDNIEILGGRDSFIWAGCRAILYSYKEKEYIGFCTPKDECGKSMFAAYLSTLCIENKPL